MSDPAMDGIHLTKDYYKDFLPTDLQWNVTEVADDFTLYDLFRLVYHASHMIPEISATMGMLQFEKFWEQIQLDRDEDDDNDVEYLELHWCIDYDTRRIKKTGKDTDQSDFPEGERSSSFMNDGHNYWEDPMVAALPNLMGFHGTGPGCPSKDFDFHECGDDCPEETGYGIKFTPVNNLAHLPIRVSPDVEFFPPFVESNRDFSRTEFKLTINPTLWCFITSIFWELTFCGSDPSEVSESKKEIIDSVDEIKEHLDKEDIDDDD